MQGNGQVICIGQATDLPRLREPASPGKVRHDDIRSRPLDIFAEPISRERPLALADGNAGDRLQADVCFNVVRRHDLLQPHHVVGLKSVCDAGGVGQVPSRVTLDRHQHRAVGGATNLVHEWLCRTEYPDR